MKLFYLILTASVAVLSACSSTHEKQQKTENLTVAKAQREIAMGMSSSEVIEVLGSPNMVTTDSERRETWVYDKMSTQVSSSGSRAGVWLVVFNAGTSTRETSSNQRTLTIIVKFDKENKVRDLQYRSTSF